MKAEARIKQLEAKRWLLSKEEIIQVTGCLPNSRLFM
jgi:hypothetical protein